jgi:hypothetical protein
MELFIPNKKAFMQAVVVGNTTLGDIPYQEHEGADHRNSLCSKAYPYKTEAGDSGDKIALKFYPEDDPLETWESIIACNMALQELYNDLYPGDEMTIHYDTVDNMELFIPDKQFGDLAEILSHCWTINLTNKQAMRHKTQQKWITHPCQTFTRFYPTFICNGWAYGAIIIALLLQVLAQIWEISRNHESLLDYKPYPLRKK